MSLTNRAVDEIAPLRGDVWVVTFDTAIGGEINKTRPAVIISNDTANALMNRVQIVPVSSRTSQLYPSEAMITVAGESRKIMADQITTADKRRLLRRICVLSASDMLVVGRTVRLHLGL